MGRLILVSLSIVVVTLLVVAGVGGETAGGKTGEELFKQHCAVCHPDGGNIVNPAKTLRKKVREASNIKKAEDIVKKMRNPGPGMLQFDKQTIPDGDAGKIADYIL